MQRTWSGATVFGQAAVMMMIVLVAATVVLACCPPASVDSTTCVDVHDDRGAVERRTSDDEDGLRR